METIENGIWQGHLGRGLAQRELQCVMSCAQGLTAKQMAQLFGVAEMTVKKRLTNAMYKLGVKRQTALVAEAMKRQIITPMCIALAALIAMHAVIDDHSMRRERRTGERRIAQVRISRRAEAFDHIA